MQLKYLDSLRGISAICVVCHHVFAGFSGYVYESSFMALPFARYVLNGQLHVHVFFALSARVICISYLNRQSNNNLLSSMIRRPFRLALPVFAGFLFAAFLSKSGFYSFINYHKLTARISTPSNWPYVEYSERPLQYVLWDTYNLFLMAKSPFDGSADNSGIAHYQSGSIWSLAAECYYSYYIYGLSFFVVNMKWLNARILLFLVFVHSIAYMKYHSFFVGGFIVSLLSYDGFFELLKKTKLFLLNIAKILLFLLLLSLCSDGVDLQSYFSAAANSLIVTNAPEVPYIAKETFLKNLFISFLLLFVVESSILIQRMLLFQPLPFLGRISFGLYLLHGPLLPFFKIFLALELPLIAVFFFYFFLLISCSYAFTLYVDDMCLELIRFVYSSGVSVDDCERILPFFRRKTGLFRIWGVIILMVFVFGSCYIHT